MEYIDHGDWVLYKPDDHWLLRENKSILFCRRESDGIDWYIYRRTLTDTSKVLLTLMMQSNGWTVMSSARAGGSELIWPEKMRLIEIVFDGDHETLRQKLFDFDAREFRDQPPVPDKPFLRAIADELGVEFDKLITFLEGSRHG